MAMPAATTMDAAMMMPAVNGRLGRGRSWGEVERATGPASRLASPHTDDAERHGCSCSAVVNTAWRAMYVPLASGAGMVADFRDTVSLVL
jgi:hypothetical protein